jgi:hypothetical protein
MRARAAALLKQLVADVKKPPRPTVVNCRAGGAFCRLVRAHAVASTLASA